MRPQFASIDRLVHANLARVQRAMRRQRIGPHHFGGSTGYGHGDLGRAALDDVVAEVMGAEAAAVRIQYVSGTHAIASALFGCLRPGDELLAVAGAPYDTLEEVIGLRGRRDIGSLSDWGVRYRVLPLDSGGRIDWQALASAVRTGGGDAWGGRLVCVSCLTHLLAPPRTPPALQLDCRDARLLGAAVVRVRPAPHAHY